MHVSFSSMHCAFIVTFIMQRFPNFSGRDPNNANNHLKSRKNGFKESNNYLVWPYFTDSFIERETQYHCFYLRWFSGRGPHVGKPLVAYKTLTHNEAYTLSTKRHFSTGERCYSVLKRFLNTLDYLFKVTIRRFPPKLQLKQVVGLFSTLQPKLSTIWNVFVHWHM